MHGKLHNIENDIKFIDSSILKLLLEKEETEVYWLVFCVNLGALNPLIVNYIKFEVKLPATFILFLEIYTQLPETIPWYEHDNV